MKTLKTWSEENGFPYNTCFGWCRDSRYNFPAYKVAGRLYVKESEAQEWLDNQKITKEVENNA